MPTLYAGKGGTDDGFYSIDPATGLGTLIGHTGGWALTGLAFDPTSGILYGVTGNASTLNPRALITVNPATGAGTLIGSLGIATGLHDISFKSDGTLYGFGGNGRGTYSVNKATGAATLIGNSGLFSGSGFGFEIDALDRGYLFPDGPTTGDKYYRLGLTLGGVIQQGTLTNPGGLNGAVAAAAFDASGVLWAWDNQGNPAALIKIAPDGTVTHVGANQATTWDALAWDGGVKPSPWIPTLFTENFDAGFVAANKWDCSHAADAYETTDGTSEGAWAFKVDAWDDDAYITADPSPLMPPLGEWIYTSFALYIPSWSDIWDGGFQWAPQIIALDPPPPWFVSFFAYATSPTTGIVTNFTNGESDSTPVPDGQWVAVEVAFLLSDGAGHTAFRYWIDNVDSGILTVPAFGVGGGASGITIGDAAETGFIPPATPANVLLYVDDFHLDLTRIGPVDLTAAYFSGVGSGTNHSPCPAHPVDDSYAMNWDHTLNVPAPGVMINDFFPTTVSLNTGPAHGSLILNADGSFSYTPTVGFFGTDSFVYNGNGGTATATITVAKLTPLGVFDGSPALVIDH